MRFLHISDLHIGKRLNEYSLLEDQKFVLDEILGIAKSYKIDAIIMAGDIYDKPTPSAEAVSLFNDFLTKLSRLNIYIFIISGNHDSVERLSFGSEIMENQKIYISPVYDGKVKSIILNNGNNKINIFLLPFIKPINVKKNFEDFDSNNYSDAINKVISTMDINPENINILVAHQLVTGAERCESEDISIGGLDNVDINVFEPFDYVALGHIHNSQYIKKPTIRYCGTPLKYSFSEVNSNKTITIIDINSKENIEIKEIPLNFLRDMKEIKGEYLQLVSKDYYKDLNLNDYYRIILTDEIDVPNAVDKLKTVYPNLMKIEYDNKRTKNNMLIQNTAVERKNPIELISEFYFQQNNQELLEPQLEFIKKLVSDIWEGTDETY